MKQRVARLNLRFCQIPVGIRTIVETRRSIRQIDTLRTRTGFACAEGTSHRQIAAKMGITKATVKVSLNTIYTKFGIDNRGVLILVAVGRNAQGRDPCCRRSDNLVAVMAA